MTSKRKRAKLHFLAKEKEGELHLYGERGRAFTSIEKEGEASLLWRIWEKHGAWLWRLLPSRRRARGRSSSKKNGHGKS